MNTKLLDEARKYVSQGISVIPTRGKIPAIKSWKEFQDRLPTESELSAWFRQDNVTGIAAVTGKRAGFCVVDIDDMELVKAWEWPDTVRARTGRGIHLYFKYPSDKAIKNKSGFIRGMDMKSDGGLVTLPPSLHVSTGKRYEWEIEFSKEKLADLPKSITDHYESEEKKTKLNDSLGMWKDILSRPYRYSLNHVDTGMCETIKATREIEYVAEPYVDLKPTSGNRMIGLCPLHEEKTPSFNIFLGSNSYYCFGCEHGGDVIDLTMRLKNYKFNEAVLWLQKCSYLDDLNKK
jgi:hypothetical protein